MQKSWRTFVVSGSVLAILVLCFIGLATRKPGIQKETPLPVKAIAVCVAIGGFAALSGLIGGPKSVSCARRTGEPLMRVSVFGPKESEETRNRVKAGYHGIKGG